MKYFTTLLLALFFLASGCKDKSIEAGSGAPWLTDWNAAFTQAKAENKPVFVDFYATWCGPCKVMDRETFPDPAVADELKNWVQLKVDVDKHPELARKYQVQGIPMMVLLNSEEKVLAEKVGMMGASELVAFARNTRSKVATTTPPSN